MHVCVQVLVSLQAMVFCRDPYFNEPGYERSCGTSSGDERSAKYNAVIVFNSMKCAPSDFIVETVDLALEC